MKGGGESELLGLMVRMTPARCRVASLLGLTLVSGCSGARVGGRTASTLAHISVTHPALIVPGLLGSRLEDERNGRVVWGKIFSLRALTVHETLIQPDCDCKDGLELPIDSSDLRTNRGNLAASGIMGRFIVIPHVAEVQAYAKTLEAFEVCGFRPGELASCGLDVNAAIFTMPSFYQLLPPAGGAGAGGGAAESRPRRGGLPSQ